MRSHPSPPGSAAALAFAGEGVALTGEDVAPRKAGTKRARCGACASCTLREDCGNCHNCRDKPKYGGPGVKKQACVNRVCHNQVACATVKGVGKRHRCGDCPGCMTAGDCGVCPNCRDKPKFGGPGVKKQSCVHRVCRAEKPKRPWQVAARGAEWRALHGHAAMDPRRAAGCNGGGRPYLLPAEAEDGGGGSPVPQRGYMSPMSVITAQGAAAVASAERMYGSVDGGAAVALLALCGGFGGAWPTRTPAGEGDAVRQPRPFLLCSELLV